jgi:hypothetical protein
VKINAIGTAVTEAEAKKAKVPVFKCTKLVLKGTFDLDLMKDMAKGSASKPAAVAEKKPSMGLKKPTGLRPPSGAAKPKAVEEKPVEKMSAEDLKDDPIG